MRLIVLIWTALEAAIFEEDVGRLQVAMHDAKLVHRIQTLNRLDEDLPDQPLLEIGSNLLVVVDLGKDITMVSVLHDYVQVLVRVLDEGLLVLDDVGVPNGG